MDVKKSFQNRVVRKKCLVCCRDCITGKDPKHLRRGFDTTYYCQVCTSEAHKCLVENIEGYDEEPSEVALCGEKRTFSVKRRNSNTIEEITTTCWAIHHSEEYYPAYPCCKNEKPLIIPCRANIARTRSSSSTPIN